MRLTLRAYCIFCCADFLTDYMRLDESTLVMDVVFYTYVLCVLCIHNFLCSIQIGPEQIEALYQFAKFQFECGNYSGAADFLYQYRALCTNAERSLSALWGKLAAEILMQNWDIALDELNRLKEIIDSKVSFYAYPFSVIL